MRLIKNVSIFASLILVVTPAAALDQTPAVVVTPLFETSATSSGQPIVLPQQNVQVIVSTYEIQAGATLPVHKHPFQRYAYVLAGTLGVSNEVTGKTAIFKTGDFILEAVEQWHKGANVGPDVVKLLVIDQIEKGQTNVVIKDR
ncbi:cupin domain-containing protein [Hansschlegelia zhihuaiae]|uniref:Cupin domain-containing protein n=1 Tax=Hansschlegelia zhihuaiae TaxID=405005 RepID=A0A4Q0MKZ5_9HYPH|nr:cupin domain-containing protein [Hansschlegelia zhihuaiae]RXF74324.1 cupin domain-containing protein [Hansschlegelia zhihuaiae]